MKNNSLSPDQLQRIDAYWRAANYLSVGQIFLADNPLLKRPLALTDIKHTVPVRNTRRLLRTHDR